MLSSKQFIRLPLFLCHILKRNLHPAVYARVALQLHNFASLLVCELAVHQAVAGLDAQGVFTGAHALPLNQFGQGILAPIQMSAIFANEKVNTAPKITKTANKFKENENEEKRWLNSD